MSPLTGLLGAEGAAVVLCGGGGTGRPPVVDCVPTAVLALFERLPLGVASGVSDGIPDGAATGGGDWAVPAHPAADINPPMVVPTSRVHNAREPGRRTLEAATACPVRPIW